MQDGLSRNLVWTSGERRVKLMLHTRDTRLGREVSLFSPSTHCTSMSQGFTPPSACLASRPHAFAMNLLMKKRGR